MRGGGGGGTRLWSPLAHPVALGLQSAMAAASASVIWHGPRRYVRPFVAFIAVIMKLLAYLVLVPSLCGLLSGARAQGGLGPADLLETRCVCAICDVHDSSRAERLPSFASLSPLCIVATVSLGARESGFFFVVERWDFFVDGYINFWFTPKFSWTTLYYFFRSRRVLVRGEVMFMLALTICLHSYVYQQCPAAPEFLNVFRRQRIF